MKSADAVIKRELPAGGRFSNWPKRKSNAQIPHPFSVMVIDIDNFKQINDHFGHHTGDRLLTTVIETIKQHVRAIDIAHASAETNLLSC